MKLTCCRLVYLELTPDQVDIRKIQITGHKPRFFGSGQLYSLEYSCVSSAINYKLTIGVGGRVICFSSLNELLQSHPEISPLLDTLGIVHSTFRRLKIDSAIPRVSLTSTIPKKIKERKKREKKKKDKVNSLSRFSNLLSGKVDEKETEENKATEEV